MELGLQVSCDFGSGFQNQFLKNFGLCICSSALVWLYQCTRAMSAWIFIFSTMVGMLKSHTVPNIKSFCQNLDNVEQKQDSLTPHCYKF